MSVSPAIVWFRDDFRLADNAALTAAQQSGAPVLCLYIRQPVPQEFSAADWWREKSLSVFMDELARQGGRLHVFEGDAEHLLPEIVRRSGATSVFWNRRYDPAGRATDTALKARLRQGGTAVSSFPGNVLHEPWTIRTQAGQAFQVCGAYWRAACRVEPLPPLPAVQDLVFATVEAESWPGWSGVVAPQLGADGPPWCAMLDSHHQKGEAAAHAALATFLQQALPEYVQERDYPAHDGTSALSCFLRTGQITPRQIWQTVTDADSSQASVKFLAELGWREFAWSLLWDHPDLATRCLRPEFEHMAWRDDPAGLEAWKLGRTGYPLVDAGMRQLWQTGIMHNRVRMVVGSFLVKHLLIDWREGERWFAHTLTDYDPASNAMNWQWVAGCGVESAPFFRIMNPRLQQEKFDAQGDYVRHWVPELARVSQAVMADILKDGCGGPGGYPPALVPHAMARARALAALEQARQAGKSA